MYLFMFSQDDLFLNDAIIHILNVQVILQNAQTLIHIFWNNIIIINCTTLYYYKKNILKIILN